MVNSVEERVGTIAAEVERALRGPFEPPPAVGRLITTGAGASEGPARLLAYLLRRAGAAAEMVPISSFVHGAPPADTCVVLSQRLSPNARLPLARARSYARTILVTTVRDDVPGVTVVRHGPRDEDGLLLRVIGPAVASAVVVRWTETVAGRGVPELPLSTARQRALEAIAGVDPRALSEIACLVAVGDDVVLCDGLRHKLLEGLGRVHPIWDVCALVHGPLQSFYDRRATVVSFERAGDSTELPARLERVLHPERHRLIRLRSPLPGPWAFLDFDLQLDWLLVEALKAHPRDLADWPGKGQDGPLYELGRDRS